MQLLGIQLLGRYLYYYSQCTRSAALRGCWQPPGMQDGAPPAPSPLTSIFLLRRPASSDILRVSGEKRLYGTWTLPQYRTTRRVLKRGTGKPNVRGHMRRPRPSLLRPPPPRAHAPPRGPDAAMRCAPVAMATAAPAASPLRSDATQTEPLPRPPLHRRARTRLPAAGPAPAYGSGQPASTEG